MAKSSVAARSSSRRTANSTNRRPSRRAAAAPTTRKASTAGQTIPAPQPNQLNEAELEVIWKTYKRTRDENLRNTLIEHHMPLVRTIAERVLQTLPKSIDVVRIA